MNNHFIINPKYSDFTAFIHTLPDIFEAEGTIVYDGRNKVKTFIVNGQTIVVKRFRKPNFFQRIDYSFIRTSKARRAYTFGLLFLSLGIATPEPMACIEQYSGKLFSQGFLVTEFCGDPDASILRSEPNKHDDLVDEIAHFIVHMHTKGCIHGDTNLTNFLYHSLPSGGYKITTIDINRSRFVSNPSRKECLSSLMRMTHVREALHRLVARYAELRQWDVDSSIREVEQKLSRFEARKRLKNKLLHR